jgi:flagellar hook-length control protein FliK
MIAVFPAPANSPANTQAVGSSPAGTPQASPFDVILTLEALAATCASLDAAPLGGGALEGAGLESLDETSQSETDDSDEEAGEGPLAFLVNLVTVPVPSGQSPEATDAAGDAAIGDVLGAAAGTHKGAGDLAGDLAGDPAGPWTAPTAANDGSAGTDTAAAGKLLLAEVAAAVKDTGDADAANTDQTNAISRAAEWLTHAPRHVAGGARDTIATPVHSPRWAEDLGTRVAMMVRGAESTASLQLTPVDLGPVEISVTVRDADATIHFGAAHAETRALLEASIPRLREMLAAQGFNLMDASVSQGFSRQARPDVAGLSRDAGPEPDVELREAAKVTTLGLLDTYA